MCLGSAQGGAGVGEDLMLSYGVAQPGSCVCWSEMLQEHQPLLQGSDLALGTALAALGGLWWALLLQTIAVTTVYFWSRRFKDTKSAIRGLSNVSVNRGDFSSFWGENGPNQSENGAYCIWWPE